MTYLMPLTETLMDVFDDSFFKVAFPKNEPSMLVPRGSSMTSYWANGRTLVITNVSKKLLDEKIELELGVNGDWITLSATSDDGENKLFFRSKLPYVVDSVEKIECSVDDDLRIIKVVIPEKSDTKRIKKIAITKS